MLFPTFVGEVDRTRRSGDSSASPTSSHSTLKKVAGLSEEQLRRRRVVSDTTLLGLQRDQN
jgi:hypothetical protein